MEGRASPLRLCVLSFIPSSCALLRDNWTSKLAATSRPRGSRFILALIDTAVPFSLSLSFIYALLPASCRVPGDPRSGTRATVFGLRYTRREFFEHPRRRITAIEASSRPVRSKEKCSDRGSASEQHDCFPFRTAVSRSSSEGWRAIFDGFG